ncbi:hypothetical protein ABZZ79_18270 [Streptomyces sp. NPDC006458]|uniref:hypothetical protein n=1 Tax=Streptomyces sp. NPDC006458 TaxID=3154302 RepID=UPI0033B398D5
MHERYVRTRPRGLDRHSPGAGEAAAPPEDAVELNKRIRAWQDDTWRDYRRGYEIRLPAAPEERA